MEIQITILKILETQKFVSKKDGSEIVKNVFIGTTQGQYPKKIAFTVMGEDKFNQMGIVVGGTYNVSFDVESREWQGKWFTEASAWRAQRMDGQQPVQASTSATQGNASQVQAPAQENAGGEQKDDLPFRHMATTNNDALQRLCRRYLKRLQYMADKHGLGFWVRDMIRENKRGECEATTNEVRMLERMVDEERIERKDIPKVVGKSYRQCIDENVFDKIDTLKRQGIYSRLSALLMAYKNKENK